MRLSAKKIADEAELTGFRSVAHLMGARHPAEPSLLERKAGPQRWNCIESLCLRCSQIIGRH